MASTSTPDVPSIPVVFTTKTAYPLPSQKFMIPSTWRRYQLSQLINKALSLPRVVPFDFLVGGEVLKGSLGERAAGEVRPNNKCPCNAVGDQETHLSLNLSYC